MPDGLSLDNDESLVAILVPEKVERLYYHRGQVGAITDKRLLYIRSKPAGISKNLQSYYTIESVDIREVTEVQHSKTLSVGGVFAGIVLLLAGSVIILQGVTGEMIGPGVLTIPIIALPTGFALIFGVRRRRLKFGFRSGASAGCWCGAMEFRRSREQMREIANLFHSRQVSTVNFPEA